VSGGLVQAVLGPVPLTPLDNRTGDVRRINPFENFTIVMGAAAIAFVARMCARATGYYPIGPFSSGCCAVLTVTDGMAAILVPVSHCFGAAYTI
jgi:hypothetical protein